MNKSLIILFLFILNISFTSAALSWAQWTANHNSDITITNGQLAEFEWTVQAVSNFQGIQGKYSIWLFRNGNNIPIKTYFFNQPTTNNGAGGYINVTPSDYQNIIGDYQVKVYAIDYFGGDTHIINLHIIPTQDPLNVICNVNPVQGYIPLNTTYTALVSGGSGIYNSYFWNFGDGQTQTTSINTIQHVYQLSGTYIGTITVTDSQGQTKTVNCPTITAKNYTQITGTCEAEPNNGNTPLTTELTVTPQGGSGTYTKYEWNLKDGTTKNTTTNNIFHTYNNPGTYKPTVTITDNKGNKATINCTTITAKNYTQITGTCEAEPNNGNTPLTTELTVTPQGGSGTYTKYEWNLKDGTTKNTTTNNIFHTYNNPGTYKPTVTITDNKGNKATINCTTITAKNYTQITGTCEAEPNNGNTPLTTELTVTPQGGSGTYTKYEWNLKDGTTKNTTTNNIFHTYNNPGTYKPTVTITDNKGNKATINCTTITAKNYTQITGTCEAEPNNGNTPLTTELTVTPQGGSGTYTKYEWNLKDGTTKNTTTNNIFHTYNNPGTYKPTVTITDNKGNKATINCTTITVNNCQPITGTCTIVPTIGYAPLVVNVTINPRGGTGIYSYKYIFGDGTIQNTIANKTTHTYNNPGIYYPKIIITDSQGNTGLIDCQRLKVMEKPINGTCEVYPRTGYAPLKTNFTINAQGGYGTHSYKYIFGDGTIQNTIANKTTHTYNNPGIYYPMVIVIDDRGKNGTIQCPTINVYQQQTTNYTLNCTAYPTSGNTPLSVNFNATININSNNKIEHNINPNTPSTTWTYTWTFGDGNTLINGPNIQYTYNNPGTFYPKVKATNGNITIQKNCPTITVNNPINITCQANPTNGTIPLNVSFTTIVTGGSGTYTKYEWNFKDGTTQNTSKGNTYHIYTKAGTYTPTVTVKDNLGNTKTTTCPTITTKNQTPTINYTLTCQAYPTSGNAPLSVNFNATITTKIINNTPSIGIAQKNNQKTTNNENKNTKTNIQEENTNTQITYNTECSENTTEWNYQWIFGDGHHIFNGPNVWHTYNNPGTYYPIVQAKKGCITLTTTCPTITTKNQTQITNITGKCYANPNYGSPPLNTTLTVLANGGSGTYINYEWDFDDGITQNTSTKIIDHTYYTNGEYSPSVIVTDTFGQSKRIRCEVINVRGYTPDLECAATPVNGNAPLTVKFDAITRYLLPGLNPGSQFVRYEWLFGDNYSYIDNSSTIYHTYEYPGTYNPVLKGIRENGAIVYRNCPTINVYYLNYTLIADPNGPYKGYVNTYLLFNASKSIGNIVKYVWDFGNGAIVETTRPYVYYLYNNTIGIFKVKLTVYDTNGLSATGYTTATIIEPTNYPVEEDKIRSGLWIGSISIAGKDGIQEFSRTNDEVYINLQLANNYEYDLKDARIIIEIPELGIKQKSSAFNLRSGQEKVHSINVQLWNIPKGRYDVKIIVQDDKVRRIKYRELMISDTLPTRCQNC
ncbi:MAG: hypothetical protein KatS3mg002_0195 [Candidatus Woesearchaeota archaeon]|nr:MAG: hypothetical protein KatS3mg002_0195 [Candidatus Woesearchaeota archaeon]